MVWKGVPIVDGSYADESHAYAFEKTINYIPEYAEQQGTRGVGKLRDAPGYGAPAYDTGTGLPIRGAHNAEGVFLVVSGTRLIQINAGGSITDRGEIPGIARCSMDHNQITGGAQVAISNGSSGYVYNTVDQSLVQITGDSFIGAKCFAYADSYILGVEPQGRFAFTSDLADALSYSTLDRYEAEGSPDKIVGQIVTHREWWLMGERTIEPFRDTGATTNTWARTDGLVMERGLAATFAVATLDNSVFWLGDDGVVYRAQGYTPQRISTMPIEQEISGYNLALAFAFTYEDEGHKIFYLTFPDGSTIGYDVATSKWHHRQSYTLNRWRLNTLTKWNGAWYGGDFRNGLIYKLDWKEKQENGSVLSRERITGYLAADGNRLGLNGINLIMDTGQPQTLTPMQMFGSMPNGKIGDAVVVRYFATGGFGNIVISTTGTLPPGITVDRDGLASGTFTGAGTFDFTVYATDENGTQVNVPQTVVVAAMTVSGALGNGRSGFSASVLYAVVGGVSPVTLSIASGSVPPALAMSGTGLLSGMRTTPGSYTWDVLATDAVGNTTVHPDSSTTGTPWAWSFIAQTALPTQGARVAPPYADPVTGLVVMTDDATNGIYLSADGGHTWAQKATGLSGGDIFNAGASAGALMAFSNSNHGWARSTDGGVTWSPILIGGVTPTGVQQAIYSPDYVFVYTYPNFAEYSADGGLSWNAATIPSGFKTGDSILAFGGLYIPQWNTWIAPGQNAINECHSAIPSGWSIVATGLSRVGCVAYSPLLDIAVINAFGGFYYRTRTGTWTFSATSTTPTNGVCWCPSLELFIGYAGTNVLYSSPDGINWTQQTITSGGNANLLIWSPVANEMFISPGTASPGHFIPYVSDI